MLNDVKWLLLSFRWPKVHRLFLSLSSFEKERKIKRFMVGYTRKTTILPWDVSNLFSSWSRWWDRREVSWLNQPSCPETLPRNVEVEHAHTEPRMSLEWVPAENIGEPTSGYTARRSTTSPTLYFPAQITNAMFPGLAKKRNNKNSNSTDCKNLFWNRKKTVQKELQRMHAYKTRAAP